MPLELEAWRALGLALEALEQQARRDLVEAYQGQVKALLACTDLPDDDPLRGQVAQLAPELEGPELRLRASTGSLGAGLQERHCEWSAAENLHAIWRGINDGLDNQEDESFANPWKSWRQELAALHESRPEDALASLPELAAEARRSRDPYSTWPLLPTGERATDIVGQAMSQVRARTGISADDLPDPTGLPDEPVLDLAEGARAVEEVQQWLLERIGLARVLGRVAHLLRSPEPGSPRPAHRRA